jgi:transposase
MLHASEQNTEPVHVQRSEFRERMATWLAEKVKCLDESGAKLGMTRLYGRAQGQQRVYDHVPKNYGSSWTMTALISLNGVEAPMVVEGAMDTLTFETYIETQVCPTLRPGDIVIMDNLSAHKSRRVRELIEARGAHLEYLPPYSPDLNPIELCWSKVKTILRSAKAMTADALVDAIRDALLSVTLEDIHAWFAHDGYAVT